jgi:C4-dicarboxylate-specific signal transduction histidine kinase
VRGDGPREILVISQEEGPDEIVVTARDSAIGIDTEKMAQLFRPLLTAKSAGLGMGLSAALSSKHVAAASGLAPNERQGATFSVIDAGIFLAPAFST